MTTALATPGQRAGLLAATFIVFYLERRRSQGRPKVEPLWKSGDEP
jgi:hypothetical protein